MYSAKDNITNKLGSRIAQERQLLTEEKWIINTLRKIKTQRNCLQIERLQLESLKSQIKQKEDKTKEPDSPKHIDISQVSAVNMMQNQAIPTPANVMFPEIPTVSEVVCNEQELDLSITNSVFGNLQQSAEFMEEIEDDDDDDELEAENIMLDIDMLMNADK